MECGAGETPLSVARRAVHALSEKTLGIDAAEVSERGGLIIRIRDLDSKLMLQFEFYLFQLHFNANAIYLVYN